MANTICLSKPDFIEVVSDCIWRVCDEFQQNDVVFAPDKTPSHNPNILLTEYLLLQMYLFTSAFLVLDGKEETKNQVLDEMATYILSATVLPKDHTHDELVSLFSHYTKRYAQYNVARIANTGKNAQDVYVASPLARVFLQNNYDQTAQKSNKRQGDLTALVKDSVHAYLDMLARTQLLEDEQGVSFAIQPF